MDWTSGSMSMQAAEQAYEARTGQSVYFGVGTYGTGDDPQRGLGACYLLNVDSVDRPLLVQSINTGSDVSGNQFDLQEGAGGCGAYNTCAGGSDAESMFQELMILGVRFMEESAIELTALVYLHIPKL